MRKTIIVFIAMCLLFVGCSNGAESNKPEIPEAIKTADNTEPTIKLYDDKTGKITDVKFEKYIEGVVAAEMDVNWSVEALKAQAILARTFTLEKIADTGGVPARGAHASTLIEEFQAYDVSKVNDSVKKAVEETRGQVLANDNKFIKSWFHAYSGGYTATAIEGLDYDKVPTPYIQTVEDPGKSIVPQEISDWNAAIKKATIREKVSAKTGSTIPDFSEIKIAESGPSGRAIKVDIGGVVVSAAQFRLALDSKIVKSTFFKSITVEGDTVKMVGQGYGHGVGMSQWGAKSMADSGKNAEEIVKYFFKDVTLVKMWQ
ncbi:SpoIID/LytB domain-containing protein [Clostridium sp. 'deep sea']|uniref:SpoIID/LytB domain-containing protein n=1 Tax=Clostridium sp. 'deep sea' TaxID=2779445 RepID=UPI00189655A5|nr:SpoIID/LytB domain-containing protein [Clostridium sp. 'deep sea']QOR34518.1 SpoIID/LytB domain-containing protein [Clostridium sp. 'deep sea']